MNYNGAAGMRTSGLAVGVRKRAQGKKTKCPCMICTRPSAEHFGQFKSPNRWCPKPGGGFANTKYTAPNVLKTGT